MNPMDSRLAQKSNLVRKGIAYGLQIPRAGVKAAASARDYQARPPIVVNSVPKSGTHLLMQVARALPGTVYFGSFVARTPSWSSTPRSPARIRALISKLTPGEVVGAHLPYSDSVKAAFGAKNALHLFIYRDPRDVAISEAHYLAEMNRWHAMHRVFSRIEDGQERIRAAIAGVEEAGFPNIRERLADYAGWLQDPDTVAVRYEDLVGENRRDCLADIAARHRALTGEATAPVSVETLEDAIDPGRSHTFRSGGVEKWRREISPENLKLFERVAPDLPALFGYRG